MSALSIFLLVIFIIVSILLILLVLIQNEEGDSIGGVFAGGSNSAFGSRSGNVLTKTSSVLGAIFFIIAFSLAVLNRTPNDDKAIEEAGRQTTTAESEDTDDFSKYEKPNTAPEGVIPEEIGVEMPAVLPEVVPPPVSESASVPITPPAEAGGAADGTPAGNKPE
jgi:preprotein translocase subunit SecG